MCGLLCAMLGARVTLTDREANLALCRANVARNRPALEAWHPRSGATQIPIVSMQRCWRNVKKTPGHAGPERNCKLMHLLSAANGLLLHTSSS